jgi:hypothetical protein
MDGKKKIWIQETIKKISSIWWIIQSGDWFGSAQVSPLITPTLITYFGVTSFLVYYFCQNKKQLIAV